MLQGALKKKLNGSKIMKNIWSLVKPDLKGKELKKLKLRLNQRVYTASEQVDELVKRIQGQCDLAVQALRSKTLCLEAPS